MQRSTKDDEETRFFSIQDGLQLTASREHSCVNPFLDNHYGQSWLVLFSKAIKSRADLRDLVFNLIDCDHHQHSDNRGTKTTMRSREVSTDQTEQHSSLVHYQGLQLPIANTITVHYNNIGKRFVPLKELLEGYLHAHFQSIDELLPSLLEANLGKTNTFQSEQDHEGQTNGTTLTGEKYLVKEGFIEAQNPATEAL